MTEDDFDKCPECGAYPKFGLRCHPKYSLKTGVMDGDYTDLVAYYSHTKEAILQIKKTLSSLEQYHVMEMEEWDGEKWVEFHG